MIIDVFVYPVYANDPITKTRYVLRGFRISIMLTERKPSSLFEVMKSPYTEKLHISPIIGADWVICYGILKLDLKTSCIPIFNQLRELILQYFNELTNNGQEISYEKIIQLVKYILNDFIPMMQSAIVSQILGD